MAKLSLDEKKFLAQANRLLTLMKKRQDYDANVKKAITFAESDISLVGKGKVTKFAVTNDMSERQKKSMLRIAENLIESPYSTSKATKALYKRQRDTFAERYGLTKKQAKKVISLFDARKNPKIASAWNKIKDLTTYDAITPILKDDNKIGDVVRNIGDEKFGLIMRAYVESGVASDDFTFAEFLSNNDIISYFEENSLEYLENMLDNGNISEEIANLLL